MGQCEPFEFMVESEVDTIGCPEGAMWNQVVDGIQVSKYVHEESWLSR